MLTFWKRFFTLFPPERWDDRSREAFSLRVCGVARSVQDWSAGKESKPWFAQLLGVPPKGSTTWDLDRRFHIVNKPDGTPLRTEGISTCGLGARGISFAAGLLWPECDGRPYDYEHESVFTVMQNHAKRAGALRPGCLPEPGWHFIVGKGYRTHMGTCIEVNGDHVVSIDAGQTDEHPDHGRPYGLQCFKRCERCVEESSVVSIDTFDLYRYFAAQSVTASDPASDPAS